MFCAARRALIFFFRQKNSRAVTIVTPSGTAIAVANLATEPSSVPGRPGGNPPDLSSTAVRVADISILSASITMVVGVAVPSSWYETPVIVWPAVRNDSQSSAISTWQVKALGGHARQQLHSHKL